MPVLHSIVSVCRLGKNDRWSVKGLRRYVPNDLLCMRRNSRTFVRGSRGNSTKRSLVTPGELSNENPPFGPDSRIRLE